jgi:hypothetical protein
MEQSAQQHFINRNQRMESFQANAPVEGGNGTMPHRPWNGPSTERMNPQTSAHRTTTGSIGIQQQRLNEARNYEHRLSQAEHLRRLSESNGNARLAETANRMEEHAQQYYADRNQRIDSLQNRVAERSEYQYTPQNRVAEQHRYRSMTQHRAATSNGYPDVPQHVAVRQPQIALPAPTHKKPTVFEKMRGLWPFK